MAKVVRITAYVVISVVLFMFLYADFLNHG